MAHQEQPEPRKALPPYLPHRTFVNTLAGWRVALPGRIDRSVLGSYSGAIQSWLLASLRYFGLIDGNGAPTETLRQLVQADGIERQKMLRDLLRAGYPFLFRDGFDLPKATPAQLQEKFKNTGAQGETATRCLSFFIAMAKEASLPLSPYLRMRRRRAINGRKATKPIAHSAATRKLESGAEGPRAIREPFQVLYDLLDPQKMDDAEQQAVWTLLQYVKKGESS